jgi:hypothetical protein
MPNATKLKSPVSLSRLSIAAAVPPPSLHSEDYFRFQRHKTNGRLKRQRPPESPEKNLGFRAVAS